jgi:hypothetical protein
LQEKKVAKMRFSVDSPDSVIFKSFEIGSKVFEFATNITTVGNVYTKSTEHTRRSVIIEIGGVGFHYMPSVEIITNSPVGGLKTLGTQEVKIDIFGTDSIPSGYEWIQLV